jgi:uncharacterized protein (DUF2126 family)/transglutaminase-like putative cysteine protease
MSIKVALKHKTTYQYDRLVMLSPHIVRLRPAPHCRTPILAYSLKIDPAEHFINWQQDPYGNYQARLVFPEPTTELSVEVELIADLTVINPFDFFIDTSAEEYPFRYEPALARELAPYLETEPAGPRIRALVQELRHDCIRTLDYIVEINHRLCEMIGYVIRMEPGIQACDETLALKSGSCRDTAWLLVQVLRHLGLASRFVSGYLIQLKPDVLALDGPSGTSVDFTDLHAWAELYVPGAGWIGLDPTSGLLAGEGHIPLACAAEPVNASAITGGFVPTVEAVASESPECKTDFAFEMAVTRIEEDPRVTKPYSDEEWAAIEALGHKVDDRLKHGDVRLTMGGEPTFVSIDCPDGPEWNTSALGGNKRVLSDQLIKRLRDQFATGALLHFGQGKWYPGEPLPRWALGCYWRRDGEPIWEDPSLYADESRNYGHSETTAEAFAKGLATNLGVDSKYAEPGYEDTWYYLWKERTLPTNVDPLKHELDDSEERKRLARIMDDGLSNVVGYALPLKRDEVHGRWLSGSWFLRREHMFLVPGDSPMGFRLPMDSLPWAKKVDLDPLIEQDPTESRVPLGKRLRTPLTPLSETDRAESESDAPVVSVDPSQRKIVRPLEARSPETAQDIPPTLGESAGGIVRTALCVEPREGCLHVFMPPQRYLEDYLELIEAIEATARSLQTPVIIEGYQPPFDPRINHLSVTPDPGVIEVNMHPAQSWDELVHQTTTLYEEARLTRLGTEKFMLDGRHTGTGGGNHIVIGGSTPLDSPVLRRPDLLRSLVAYWHNHPSLSYLFSGLFIGPTSQAPRLDEARNDSLYEMEIAFRQIPDHGGCPPWLVDRVFRNLLVDVTGNTHRAEFCIDKLYSPDSSSGRRGLVEMRAFEMPPHPQMSLVQQLLIRSLIAKFWDAPYEARLATWGTELHDRFLLPHFVEQDFTDVVEDLESSGIPIRSDWFRPHVEFRFPYYGQINPRGVRMELRQAIEPWHVLGEESGGSGTVRYVDSSVERLQIKVQGMTESRHIVTCNGRQVPLHPTGINGEFVAGVRYRAWKPPSCLHPTIPSHAPVTFDLVDLWQQRSMGGFVYNVAHPGGRSYDTFPVNSYEAEGRRTNRFVPFGHTQGRFRIPTEERNCEAPFTLDLRRPLPRREGSPWSGA